MRIGMLTSGGDCQALNAAMRGVAKTLFNSTKKPEIYGFLDGYKGLIDKKYRLMKEEDFSGILTVGGTILGTSRLPFKYINDPDEEGRDKVASMIDTYQSLKLDCLVVLGGNGSHTTAASHSRVFIVEIMGHKTGWLALYSGIAGGADIILIPEIPYNIEEVLKTIKVRENMGKKFTIIAMAEGAISDEEAKLTKKELKEHRKKFAFPSAAYRLSDEIKKNMVCISGGKLGKIPLSEVAGKTRMIEPDNELVRQAEELGISMGRKAL